MNQSIIKSILSVLLVVQVCSGMEFGFKVVNIEAAYKKPNFCSYSVRYTEAGFSTDHHGNYPRKDGNCINKVHLKINNYIIAIEDISVVDGVDFSAHQSANSKTIQLSLDGTATITASYLEFEMFTENDGLAFPTVVINAVNYSAHELSALLLI